MASRTHHVFFSYARADNGEDNNLFVSRFHDLLCKEHQAVTGRELKTFFDTEAIDSGEHWKTRLGQGLRDSRLFLAFLSDNYLKSPVCKWEWEHYLLTEHTAARGEDGVVPLYFIPIDELGRATEEQLAEWVDEIKQRNLGAYCQLQPWYKAGRDRVRDLDAAERTDALRGVDVESTGELTLPERIRRLNLRICRRLDRIHLAEQVIGNVVRPYRHFVGRHKQLRELHEALTVDQTSLLATVHSPGGLGKSALARQYAIAYADFYAAGGVWELKCAGPAHLGDALRQLEQKKELTEHGFSLEDDREKPADEQAQSALSQLKRITHSRRDTVNQQLRDLKNRHTPEDQLEVRENSRCLLILDNVDKTELLAADQLSLIPAEDWLSVIVTTRLSPDSFGAATSLRSIEVPPLSLIEGVELLRTFMPGEAFPDAEEAKAAEELVKALDGYTIALELIGAFVHTNWKAGARLSKYLRALEKKGLAATDELAGKQGMEEKITYQHKQIALIVEDSLASLRTQLAEEHGEEIATAAKQLIEIASLLQPDTIPSSWLEAMLKQAHPDLEETDEGLEPWGIILQALMQLSLLNPAERQVDSDDTHNDVLRIHRVTAAHIGNQLSDEGERHWGQIESYLGKLAAWLEQDSNLSTIAERNQHQQWLIAQAPRLIDKHPSPKILRSLHLAVSLEGQHQSLSLAIEVAEPIKKHRAAILACNPNGAEAARDLSASQGKLGDLYLQRGQPGYAELALDYYEASLKIAEDLYARNPDSAEAARDLSVSQNKLGNFHLQRGQPGDAEQALGYYEASLKTREDLYAHNPDSVEAARDQSISQQKLGNFHMQRGQPGDTEQALGYYEASLKIAEDLHHRNPDSAQAASDLSLSQSAFGDALWKADWTENAERALGYFEASMKIAEDLHRRNPDSAETARDLSVSQVRLGDALRTAGRAGGAERALRYYEASVRIAEDLHRRNPDSAETARALSVSQVRLGDALRKADRKGDAERALNYYETGLKTHESLYARNPDNVQTERDLVTSQNRLGDFLRHRGQPGDVERAHSFYEAAIKTRGNVYGRNPHSAQAARDLSAAQRKLGDFLRQRCKSDEAESAQDRYKASLEIATEFYRQYSDSAEAARDLSLAQYEFGFFFELRGLPGDAERAQDWYAISLETVDAFYRRNPDSSDAAHNTAFLLRSLGNVHRIPIRVGSAEQALDYYQGSVETLEIFLRRNANCAKIARDLSTSQSELGHIYWRRGQPGDVERALDCYEASLKIDENLHRREPSSTEAANNLRASLERLERFHRRRDHPGDAERALNYCKASLEVVEEFYAFYPESAKVALDLSKCQKKLAGLFRERGHPGDIERALGYYKGAVEVCATLYRRGPDRIKVARDLSKLQSDLGDLYRQRGQPGDIERTLDCYKAAVKVLEELQHRTPLNLPVTRDLSASQATIARFYWQRGQPGDVEQALSYYRANQETRKEIQRRDPDDAQAASLVSTSQITLGDIYFERGQPGDTERALGWYQASLETLNEFHSGNSNLTLKGNLAISQEKLGDFYCQSSEPANERKALSHYETALEIREGLHRQHSNIERVVRDLTVLQNKLGDFHLQRGHPGDFEQALVYYEACHKTLEELYARNPDSAQAARDLSGLQKKIGDLYRERGQPGDADQALRYYEAMAQALEDLLARSAGGAESVRQLVANDWKSRPLASHAESDGLIQLALEKIYRLMLAMKANGIPFDSDCNQILSELDQMLSNNQSQ